MSSGPVSILLIQDRVAAVGVLRLLDPSHFHVTHVRTLPAALALLGENGFGAVVIEPGADPSASQMLAAIASLRHAARDAVVLLLLDHQREALHDHALAAGASEVLISGRFDANGLNRILNHAIARMRGTARVARESERAYETIIRTIVDGVIVMDMAGRLLSVNDAYCQLLGYSRDELLAMTVADLDACESPEAALQHIGRVVVLGSDRFESRHRCKDGRILDVAVSTSYVDLDGGILAAVVCDITTNNRVIAELRASEAQFREVFEQTPVGKAILGLDATCLKVNPALCRFLGYTAAELIGRSLMDITHPDDREVSAARRSAMVAGGETATAIEKRYFAKDGHIVWMEVGGVLIRDDVGQPDHFVVALQDISARKRQEALTQVRLQLHEHDAGHARSGMLQYALDTIGTLTHSPIGSYQLVDADQQTLTVQGWSTSTAPQARETRGRGLSCVLADGGLWADCVRLREPAFHNPDEPIQHHPGLPAGHAPVVRELVAPVIRGDRVIAILGFANKPTNYDAADVALVADLAEIVWEVAEGARAAEALQRSQTNWQTTFDAVSDAICLLDDEHNILQANAAMNQMFGGVSGTVVGRKCWEAVHGADGPIPGCPVEGVLRTGASERLQRDVGDRCLDITAHPVGDADGRIVGAVLWMRDVTAVRDAERARREIAQQVEVSQKLEAIGQLASGVAHDFNNLLSVILNFTQFAIDDLPADGPIRDNLLEVVSAGRSAAGLTRQLLTFARKHVRDPEVLDLNQVAADLHNMLRRLLGAGIDCRQVLTPNLRMVMADPGQIEQVIMNLMVNAWDAMPTGGQVTLETANVDLDEEQAARLVDMAPGPYVMLAVSDNGCGMDAATQQHMFEPFFTTKGIGKGTGLGLATVHGIVKQSGGHITVCSEPGRGTTFIILLPQVPELVAQTSGVLEPSPVDGHETILVVDDEQVVRTIAVRLLAAAGYKVLVAFNGEEALSLCEQSPEQIDLVLADVVMPGMNGGQLAKRLAEVRPELPVLFMTGGVDEARMPSGVLDAGARIVAKPFYADGLARKVRETLDGVAAPN